MKRIIFTLALVCVVAGGAFAQTTADEWFEKAGEYFDKGDYANAVTAYNETIKRDSSNLDAYWFRGVAYYQIKNYDAAIADCDTVIKGAPDFSDVYAVRGDAYGAKGVYHKAVADYRIALEKGLDPNRFNVDKSSNASMWFCGAMYMEIAVNRFLGKSDVVTKYENWLKTVSDKNKVTRAEIEKFYRDNVRSLIAAVVDEEFNKVSFLFENARTNPIRSHISMLTRNPQTGQYILNYWGAYTNGETRTVTGNSPDALFSEMRNGKNKSDFDETGISAVRAQAALIPAVVYADWKAKGVANGVDGMALIKEALTNFYLDPSQNTYNAVLGIYARCGVISVTDGFARTARVTYVGLLDSLNPALSSRVVNTKDLISAARLPNDRRFNIFSTPYTAR